jgi:hypothetical protein
VEFANVYAIGELVEKFDERSEPLDSGFDFGLEDLDAVFALNFLEVDEDCRGCALFFAFLCLFLAGAYCYSATHMVVTWTPC